MKPFTGYITFDGCTHQSYDAADRHLEKLYGDLLCGLSRRLLAATDGKYAKTPEFIDTHLSEFCQLQKIKDDMPIQEDEE